jgi:hypothetical protein
MKNLDCYFFKILSLPLSILYIYTYTHAAKNRRFSFFFALSRSVHFFFQSLYSIYLICFFFCLFFWTVCQIDYGFLFGHRDRSETHPAYLPSFSVKLSFMRIFIYSLSIYFFLFFSLCIMNGLLPCYVCMLFYSRCGKYRKKKKKKEETN